MIKKNYTAVGTTIRVVRKTKNLTVREVAGGVGFSAGFLSRLERDLVRTTEPFLVKLSQVLGVPEQAIAVEEQATPIPVLNGYAVRAIRIAKGLRPAEFAKELGIDKAALADMESTQMAVPVATARAIADVLRVPLMTIFVVPPVWR